MPFLLKKLAGLAVRKIAADPRARQMAAEAARKVTEEAKVIAKSDNKSYEAGRSARRLLNRFQDKE